MEHDEIRYSIALRRCKNIGDMHMQRLISYLGDAKAVWNTPKKELVHICGVGYKIVEEIGEATHLDFASRELEFCIERGVTPLLRHLGQLPGWLAECDDAPSILYVRGKIPPSTRYLSIVGTRNITAYGKQFVQDLFQRLSEAPNIYTVSGLALGVDSEVHWQSLQHHIPTIAVLAHGHHTLYPAKNRVLSEKIIEEGGALFTEFNSSQKPDREHFIQRNRIIAGISASTIVVETAFGGGSISTANFANGYNRDVYALPGRYVDKYSQGCNMLIGENKAKAIYSFEELMLDLGFAKDRKKTDVGHLFPVHDLSLLSLAQQKLYHTIKDRQKITADELSLEMDFRAHELMAELLQLEILGIIQCDSSRRYSIM